MADDDYLSDKFLASNVQSAPPKPITYRERRALAQKQSELKKVQNRKKSRRQLEEESREEGLKTSLFERAKEEEVQLGVKNKAMAMMLKMGFKPGQSLGRTGDSTSDRSDFPQSAAAPLGTTLRGDEANATAGTSTNGVHTQHRKQPLPVDVWSGKKGLGLGKRAVSPSAAERLAKAIKLEEATSQDTYRNRTREEYEERRAEGRLLSAIRTLLDLDGKAGIEFNFLSLNPLESDSFPPELLDALTESVAGDAEQLVDLNLPHSDLLKQQMRRDALQPLEELDSESEASDVRRSKDMHGASMISPATVEASKEFLQLNARQRLNRVLAYLRSQHYYCFWCGTQYNDEKDMLGNCPGEEEDAHD